ncbi:HNH endonuclease, partial [Campylobacter upsaliensis]|nr:HNH endonuclease [Campylobacter upsaliensis]
SLENFIDFSQKTIPKNMRYILAFYALIYDEKQIFWWNSANKNFSFNLLEIEHILPRKWQDNYYQLEEDEVKNLVEQIGNKILIEKKLNISASNEFFAKKKEHYATSFCAEVKALSKSSKKDWSFKDIEERNKQIYAKFSEFFSGIF